MRLTELEDGIPSSQAFRESTRIFVRPTRGGTQQFCDRGFGKTRNTDFEPLHYRDT